MSDADEGDVEETRDVPNRVRSLHATIETAIEKAGSSGWSSKFSSSDVQEWSDADLPDRTLRRALHDAVALGWIEKDRQKWRPAERAEQHAPEEEPTPNGFAGRQNSDDAWHIMAGSNESLCGVRMEFYLNDDAERERIGHMADDDSEIRAVDLCNDCLGLN